MNLHEVFKVNQTYDGKYLLEYISPEMGLGSITIVCEDHLDLIASISMVLLMWKCPTNITNRSKVRALFGSLETRMKNVLK